MTAPALSRGAVALKNCGKSLAQIARMTGFSYTVVNNWVRGHRTPGDPARGVIEEKLGISRWMWDEPAPAIDNLASPKGSLLDAIDPSTKPLKVPSTQDGRNAGSAVSTFKSLAEGSIVVEPRNEAEALVAHIRRYRLDAEQNPTLSPTERAKVLETASRAVERLYRLTGEVANIPDARILASPAWGRIKAAVAGALESHPDALAAVTDALEGLAREG